MFPLFPVEAFSMRCRSLVLFLTLLIASSAHAQRGRGDAPAGPVGPAPRWPDGHVNLNAPTGTPGIWTGNGGRLAVNPNSYEPNASANAPIHIDDVPIQEWARALTNFRHRNVLADEPHS